MLQSSLHDTEHLNVCSIHICDRLKAHSLLSQVQLAAARALSAFVLVLERTQRGAFTDLLPITLDV